jgi:streptogramin lyase
MQLFSSPKRRLTRRNSSPNRRAAWQTFRPRLEVLEDRCLLSYTINEFPVPTPNAGPDSVTAGPDGNLWFSEINTPMIAKITPQGSVSEIALPISSGQNAGQIVFGPNGNLWFPISTLNASNGTPSGTGEILEMTPTGTVVQTFTLPAVDDALSLTQGPDGNIWFADYYSGTIGQLTPSGAVS